MHATYHTFLWDLVVRNHYVCVVQISVQLTYKIVLLDHNIFYLLLLFLLLSLQLVPELWQLIMHDILLIQTMLIHGFALDHLQILHSWLPYSCWDTILNSFPTDNANEVNWDNTSILLGEILLLTQVVFKGCPCSSTVMTFGHMRTRVVELCFLRAGWSVRLTISLWSCHFLWSLKLNMKILHKIKITLFV